MHPQSLDLSEPTTTLRRLRHDEAPYPGQLHTDPAVVWVDLDLVPDALWQCAPDGHVLVPLDIARTSTGHAAIFPHCAERLSSLIDESTGDGSAVTIAVSMLRAATEAYVHGFSAGAWWVSGSGRPVLAVGGSAAWHIEGSALLARLAERSALPLRAALLRAVDLLAGARFAEAAVIACEDALFAAAEPAPLGQAMSATVQENAPRLAETFRRDRTDERAASLRARWTDADWAARVVSALRALAAVPAQVRDRHERHERHERHGRRRASALRGSSARAQREAPGRWRSRAPWLVAAAAGAVVIAAGLLWPEPTPTASAGSRPEESALHSASSAQPGSVSAAPTPAAAPEPMASSTGPEALVAVASRVLGALSVCAGAAELTCAPAMEDPAAATPHGLVSAGAADVRATLLDEYGGVAVLRIEADAQPTQILVLVSANGTWLVRDVYDVADQP